MNTARPSIPSRPMESQKMPLANAGSISLLTPAQKETMAPTHEEIARKAYEIWLSLGREQGRDQEHWFEAERQLRGK